MSGGRAWVFGDDIDTDVLAPGAYMKSPIEELATHVLEAVEPRFAKEVVAGDLVVGGWNFGIGSSREQAPECLRILGVRAVIARSFARIFFRNSINLALPALVCAEADSIQDGDRLEVDISAATVHNLSRGATLSCEPLPDHLLEIIGDGGLLANLEKRLANRDPT
jgi:3-isopropylmalate/(R)-2-methylmalate dehydratase small subunit